MVSAPTPPSANSGNNVSELVEQRFSNKRKLTEIFPEQEGSMKKSKPPPSVHSGTLDSTGLQLETPLPLNWQQSLDIQSRKVYSGETRTSREGGNTELSRARPTHMRLDLELNLLPSDTSEPKRNQLHADLNDSYSESSDLLFNLGIKKETEQKTKEQISSLATNMSSLTTSSSISNAPSWLAFEGDEKSEMVATVCKRCFMLVMLCKASPACPNCKFMHSPDQSAPYLFKPRPTQVLYGLLT